MNLYFIEMDVAIILVTALHKCISKKIRSHSGYPWLVQPANFSYIT